MTPDRLDALLKRFRVSARMFHAGPLCGRTDFDGDHGYLHLIQRGPLTVHHARGRAIEIDASTLLFYPQAHAHTFVSDPRVGAEMVCASVAFEGGASHPIARALPPVVSVPLAGLTPLRSAIELLFAEAGERACGRQAVVDRVFEVVLIQLLRVLMNSHAVLNGMLAGLADPRLAKAITALHEQPDRDWTLDALAQAAGMSRTSFANAFKSTVGVTPGDYLADWRMAVAQDLLRDGRPLKQIALDVGYGSPAALSRAFHARTGRSPRAWLATARDAAPQSMSSQPTS